MLPFRPSPNDRLYVQTVDYVLVPDSLNSPGSLVDCSESGNIGSGKNGGSAVTAVPSMVLLAFTLLLGRVAIICMGKLT